MLNIATENICKCPADDPAGGREINLKVNKYIKVHYDGSSYTVETKAKEEEIFMMLVKLFKGLILNDFPASMIRFASDYAYEELGKPVQGGGYFRSKDIESKAKETSEEVNPSKKINFKA